MSNPVTLPPLPIRAIWYACHYGRKAINGVYRVAVALLTASLALLLIALTTSVSILASVPNWGGGGQD